ncbi:MAG: hypothetical protein ACJ798_12410 [Phenylobacterium sp.]
MAGRGPHFLVVGGSGMLAPVCEALAEEGGRLSLLSRHAKRFWLAGARPYDCNYYDDAAFGEALAQAVEDSGPVDLAIAWFHTLKIPAVRRLAERVGRPRRAGRLFQVLGSATADPARPERLQAAAATAEDLPNCRLRQVVLGFRVEAGRSRWLSDAEIADGVLEAVHADRTFSVVGQLEPWSARP